MSHLVVDSGLFTICNQAVPKGLITQVVKQEEGLGLAFRLELLHYSIIHLLVCVVRLRGGRKGWQVLPLGELHLALVLDILNPPEAFPEPLLLVLAICSAQHIYVFSLAQRNKASRHHSFTELPEANGMILGDSVDLVNDID